MKTNFCPICDIFITPSTTSAECQHWGHSELVNCDLCHKQYIKGWDHTCDFSENLDSLTEEFKKFDSGKPKISKLPWLALEGVCEVMEYGAEKYNWDNWKLCDDPQKYADAMGRHYAAYHEGEINDPESGLNHWKHIAVNALFRLWFEMKKEKQK